MRITNQKDWADIIAEGTSSTLQYFKKNYTGGQKHQIRILCFFEEGHYCIVKVCINISNF